MEGGLATAVKKSQHEEDGVFEGDVQERIAGERPEGKGLGQFRERERISSVERAEGK